MMNKDYWKKKWRKRMKEGVNPFAIEVCEYLKNKTHEKHLLDLGSGNGADAIYFADQGFQVTALDQTTVGFQNIQKAQATIHTIQADICQLPFQANTFDVVYAHLSLHYFDDLTTQNIFNQIHTILKTPGLLFVKCKSTDDPLFGKGKKIAENMYQHGHIRHFFSQDYLIKKLEKFHLLTIENTCSNYHGYRSNFVEAIAMK